MRLVKCFFRLLVVSSIICTFGCNTTQMMVDSMDPLMKKMDAAVKKKS